MSSCAVDQSTCQRLTTSAQKAICKAKGITGYNKLEPEDIAKTCCEEGGIAMPKNLKFKNIENDVSSISGKDLDTVVKESFKKLLKNVLKGEIDAIFGSKKRVCLAGSLPGDVYSSSEEMKTNGVLTLAEQGKLDLGCVKKCLDVNSNYSCAVETGKPRYGRNEIKDILFFGNYDPSVEGIKKTFKGCKNDLELFWNVFDGMNKIGNGEMSKCKKGDLSCGQRIAGYEGYGNKTLDFRLKYDCNKNYMQINLVSESNKYDSRAFGDREYDQQNRDVDYEKIEKSMGIDIPDAKIKQIFGNEIKKLQKEPPRFQWQDKSFNVTTMFTFEYPPLKTKEDADDLKKKIINIQRDLGKYV